MSLPAPQVLAVGYRSSTPVQMRPKWPRRHSPYRATGNRARQSIPGAQLRAMRQMSHDAPPLAPLPLLDACLSGGIGIEPWHDDAPMMPAVSSKSHEASTAYHRRIIRQPPRAPSATGKRRRASPQPVGREAPRYQCRIDGPALVFVAVRASSASIARRASAASRKIR